MYGIDLNEPITFRSASFRFFKENEHHIERNCPIDVLLLVYEGTLRFSEDGVEYEVPAGQYHIQKANTYQKGTYASDSPKYLWVHFCGVWRDCEAVVPQRGYFNYNELRTIMEALNRKSHANAPYIESAGLFYTLLSSLRFQPQKRSAAQDIADYISYHYLNELSLDKISAHFHISKNHVINLFKKEYDQTPTEYIISKKLARAEYLLEVTSDSLESIALSCGFHQYSHFYRLFIRKNGISPSQWRQAKHRLTLPF